MIGSSLLWRGRNYIRPPTAVFARDRINGLSFGVVQKSAGFLPHGDPCELVHNTAIGTISAFASNALCVLRNAIRDQPHHPHTESVCGFAASGFSQYISQRCSLEDIKFAAGGCIENATSRGIGPGASVPKGDRHE